MLCLDLAFEVEIRIKEDTIDNLGKTHCGGMAEGNSKKEGYLLIWFFNMGYE